MNPDLPVAYQKGILAGMSVVVAKHCLMCCSRSGGVALGLMAGMEFVRVLPNTVG